MDGTQRLGRNRRSRRSRSQRDRERKLAGVAGRDPRPYTPSSGSDQERAEGPCSSRPRPPRRRRRESTSCEEDIIDGFAITSFVSLETLEREAVLKPPERTEAQQKRPEKRRPEEQGSSSPGEGPRRNECPDSEQMRQNGEQDGRRAPPAKKVKTKVQSRGNESTGGENGSSYRSSSRGPGSDESVHSSLGTGYFCDIDSDPDDKSISEDPVQCPKREAPSASPHSLSTRWKSTLFGASDEGLSKLFSTASKIAPSVRGSADPRPETQVSGLERSQERNQESEQAVLPAGPPNPHPQPPPPPQLQPPTPPQSAAQPGHDPSPPKLSQGQGQSQPVPPPAQPGPQARLQPFTQNYSGGSRSSTPSKPLAPSSQVPHRASTPSSLGLSSHPSTHVFASGLRTPAHPHHPAVFAPSPGLPPPPPLNSTMLQVAGHPSPAAAATFSEQELIRQELNSRYLSSQGPERGSSLGPPSFQFHQHQHSHQHTHQHTHQHFAPYPPMAQAGLVPAPTAPMYFQTYHTACPTVPAVLSTAGPFSSLQGAFQPKNPSAELASRPGPVPHTLLRKDPRLTEVYRPPVRKPGKWCAMHVRIAWMIHRHQEKNKVEHQKLDLAKADLLSRGPSVFSPVAPTHDLARPITLFTATGAVHSATPPFGPPTALSPFLSTSSPLASAIFAPKECPSSAAPPPAYSSSRDQWSHLHQTPPAFPTPPPTWARLGEAERERGLISEKDKREVLLLKEEQEREGPYSRHPFRTPVEERLPTPLERRAPPLPQRVKPEPSRGDQPRPRDRPETGGVGGGVGKEEVEGGGCPFPGLRAVPLPLIVSPGSPAELSLLPPHLLRLGQPHPPPYPWDPWAEAVPLPARRCPPPPTEREREREPTAQRHSLLQEEYEQRARLLAGGFLPTPPHPYPRLSPSLLRQSTLLPKTPPLGGPPPLISSSSSSSATSSSTRALSPRQRGAPASDLRDLPPPSSTYPHRERDAR
ncbi:autism susceptibility gene 2 protein homolog isoform X2 [Hypanus sabinus]|uniref:autism susceptibility gene 2 protein homolog isoform X2 n=1 Tax=Hypanus sabinus TaxID=79690 RepID=UPI0028C392E7|nr:autism susceptibility gene 2 protein homolog isoform X2 [Hypanus sabinus]